MYFSLCLSVSMCVLLTTTLMRVTVSPVRPLRVTGWRGKGEVGGSGSSGRVDEGHEEVISASDDGEKSDCLGGHRGEGGGEDAFGSVLCVRLYSKEGVCECFVRTLCV